MTGQIRRAVGADADALTSCISAAYAGYFQAGIDLPDVSAGVAEDIAAHLVWVHETGADITGGIFVSHQGAEAHLMNLAVHPDHMGKRIGSALIDTALAHLVDLGVCEVHLATHKDMPDNVSLYEHLGWRVTGRDGAKVLMTRTL